jgi:putative FmdB family regulatory protein
MPLYDYACGACATHFEALRPVASRNIARCPNCRSDEQVALFQTNVTSIAARSTWRARSNAERLTGGLTRGPGTRAGGARSHALHVCGGKNCSVCGI